MRIAVFGLPNQIIHTINALLKAQHTIPVIIPPAPNHQAHTVVVQYAQAKKIPCLFFEKSPKEHAFIEALAQYKPDVAFVCGFDKLIPPEILKIPPLGFINFHPSYLPDYRGGNAYFYIIKNGETISGVTAHYMDEHFDTGDIIYQKQYPISDHETMGTLANKAEEELAKLAVRIANELREGKKIPRTPQPKGIFKKATSILPERGDTKINWNTSAEKIERFIRACNPFYGAITTFRNKLFVILQAQVSTEKTTAAPGTIIKCTSNELLIATENGSISPTVIQYDNYMIGTIDRFIQEINPTVGEILN